MFLKSWFITNFNYQQQKAWPTMSDSSTNNFTRNIWSTLSILSLKAQKIQHNEFIIGCELRVKLADSIWHLTQTGQLMATNPCHSERRIEKRKKWKLLSFFFSYLSYSCFVQIRKLTLEKNVTDKIETKKKYVGSYLSTFLYLWLIHQTLSLIHISEPTRPY